MLVGGMQAIARIALAAAAVLALFNDPPHQAPLRVQPASIALPAAAPVAEKAVLGVDMSVSQGRPSKCGDLPRAPWNTCVALHDHEI